MKKRSMRDNILLGGIFFFMQFYREELTMKRLSFPMILGIALILIIIHGLMSLAAAQTYTGCLNSRSGIVSSLQNSDIPLRPCGTSETDITLSDGDITSVLAGTGLEGGDISGDISLSIAEPYRLPQGCSANQVAQWSSGGSWICSEDENTTYTNGPGLILADNQFEANFAGTGASDTVARSDHDHEIRYASLDHIHPPSPMVAAYKFWTSPFWVVREGVTGIQLTALNLGLEEVTVFFTFFDRDGNVDTNFTTYLQLPSGANYTYLLDDRGIDPGKFGWFAVTASGPIQVDGYVDLTLRNLTVPAAYSRRTLHFYPVVCTEDPSTWAPTGAPFLCAYIERELPQLW